MSTTNGFTTIWLRIRSYLLYTEQLDPLLALRGFACLIVMWYHIRAPIAWLYINFHNWSFITAPNGPMAVYIFYLLSGYGVGYGFFSKKYTLSPLSLRSFYINRFLRIAPAYYVCVLLSIFIFYPHAHVTISNLIHFFTFTMNIDYFSLPFQLLLVNISTEMQFYLIAPLLYIALSYMVRKMHPLVVGASILLLGSAVRYALLHAGLVPDMNAFMIHVFMTVWGVIDYFLFGMFLSYIMCEHHADIIQLKRRIPNLAYYTILIGWLLWVNYSTFDIDTWPAYATHQLFFLPPTLCIVLGWYILSRSVRRAYTPHVRTALDVLMLIFHPRTFFYGIGFISYGFYMYHFVYLNLIYFLPGYSPRTWPAFSSELFTAFIVTMATALASYYFVEYPFLKLKSHKP